MYLQRLFQRNRKAEAHRSSLPVENDRTPNYTSNVTTAPNLDLPGRDSPDETKSSPGALHFASDSKRPSGKFKFSPLIICVIFFSLLPDLR